MYLRLSSGSRGTRGSASTDQSSCQRLNKMAGRGGGAWSSAWTDWSAPATPPRDNIRAATQTWILNRLCTDVARYVRLFYDSEHRFICQSTNESRRYSLRG